MKKFLLFFFIIFLFGDVSDEVFKIKAIENSKKIFLKYPLYNIFVNKKTVNNIQQAIIQPSPLMKIYAVFNNKVNINGEWKKKGEYINDYKIVKILPDKIILKKENKLRVLKFKTNIIKVSK